MICRNSITITSVCDIIAYHSDFECLVSASGFLTGIDILSSSVNISIDCKHIDLAEGKKKECECVCERERERERG